MKTTLRTVLTALTLFAPAHHRVREWRSRSPRRLGVQCRRQLLRRRHHRRLVGRHRFAASDHPPGTTGFVLAIAETYYGGDVEAAITALTEAFASEEMREQIIDVLTSR